MSENEPQPGEDELPIKKYLDSSRVLLAKVKGFEFRSFFQGLIVFLSIIAAYFFVEITHQHRTYFEKITRIKLNQQKTLAQMFFLLSLYLIFWRLLARFLKRRALQPPKKLDQYQEVPQEESGAVITLPALPNGEKYYHEIIQTSLNSTIYYFLLFVSVLSYAYFSQARRANLPSLVSIDRVNYLCIWFLAGNLFTLLGDLTHKVTKIRQFRVLGVAIKYLVGVIALGLANGLNAFIFI